MALTHAAATRNGMSDLVLANIDVGTAGNITLYLANGTTEVASLTLADPAGIVTTNTLDFDCIPPLEDAAPTGNASPVTIVKIRTSADADVLLGSVGISGEDLNFPGGNTFSASDTVQISSLSYVAPP